LVRSAGAAADLPARGRRVLALFALSAVVVGLGLAFSCGRGI